MISTCPHCAKEFNFSEGQVAKIEAALATLKGGTLKLKCPRCFEPVELSSDGTLADWRQPAAGCRREGQVRAATAASAGHRLVDQRGVSRRRTRSRTSPRP